MIRPRGSEATTTTTIIGDRRDRWADFGWSRIRGGGRPFRGRKKTRRGRRPEAESSGGGNTPKRGQKEGEGEEGKWEKRRQNHHRLSHVVVGPPSLSSFPGRRGWPRAKGKIRAQKEEEEEEEEDGVRMKRLLGVKGERGGGSLATTEATARRSGGR